MRQKLSYWGYRAVWDTAAVLPRRLADATPESLGSLWYFTGSAAQRDQVRANLARVLDHPPRDELEEVVRAAYVSYARYWLDAFRLHTFTPEGVMSRSSGTNLHLVDDMLADGEGGILATAHLGSWDIGAYFTTQRDWGMAVVAEVVEPRRLFERFVQLRRDAGIEVVPLVRGGDMVDRMVDVVERGGLATLLADRDLGRRGPVVEFFGEPCRLPPGCAVLARRTGRPVAVGAFVTEGDDGFRGLIHSRIDIADLSVEEGTQALAHELEGLIRRAPEQWHVFVRNWLVEREPDHPEAVAWREAHPGGPPAVTRRRRRRS
nr:phosphatidylinositol mannoside acyltransferase [Salsipaludibacter albus]